MESFDLPNPLHWCHMDAMASLIISILPALCEGNPPVTSVSPNQGTVMWKVEWCRIISIEIIKKFTPGEQAIFLMAYFIDAYASLDFKEFTHIY